MSKYYTPLPLGMGRMFRTFHSLGFKVRCSLIRVYFEPDEKQCVDHTGWNITQGIEFQLAEMQTGEILSNSSNCLARRLAEPRGL